MNFVLNLVSDILSLPFSSATNPDDVSTDRNIYTHLDTGVNLPLRQVIIIYCLYIVNTTTVI